MHMSSAYISSVIPGSPPSPDTQSLRPGLAFGMRNMKYIHYCRAEREPRGSTLSGKINDHYYPSWVVHAYKIKILRADKNAACNESIPGDYGFFEVALKPRPRGDKFP